MARRPRFATHLRALALLCLALLVCPLEAAAQQRKGKPEVQDRKQIESALGTDLTLESHATDLVKTLIQGIYDGDYALFTANFASSLKQSQTRENFLQLQKGLQKALGRMQSSSYLGFYRQSGDTAVLFKARFTKDKDDVLIRLVLEGQGAQGKLKGFWFESPLLEQ